MTAQVRPPNISVIRFGASCCIDGRAAVDPERHFNALMAEPLHHVGRYPGLQDQRRAGVPIPWNLIGRTFVALISLASLALTDVVACTGSPSLTDPKNQDGRIYSARTNGTFLMPVYREEVVNVQLAQALVARGFHAQPETVTRKKQLPDVIVNLGGLKLVIEGRVDPLLKKLRADAAERIVTGLADISLAVSYPKQLKSAESIAQLREHIEAAQYSGSIFSFGSSEQRVRHVPSTFVQFSG